MKLTEREQKILSYAEMRSNRGVKEIAHLTGYREHTVNYSLEKLKKEKIIHPIGVVSLYPAGYIEYGIYFSLRSESKETKRKLIHKLLAHPNIPWIGEFGGEYQYAATLAAKNITEVIQFLEELSQEFGDIFFHKSFCIRVYIKLYNRAHLFSRKGREIITIGGMNKNIALDELDEKILDFIQRDASLSYVEMAKKIGAPASTIKYRIKKHEKNNIIVGYTYAIDSTKIGTQLFVLFLYARGMNPTLEKQLNIFAKENPNTIYFFQGLGEWDFEFGLEVKNPEQITEIIEELYQKFGDNITTIRTAPIFRYLKYSQYSL